MGIFFEIVENRWPFVSSIFSLGCTRSQPHRRKRKIEQKKEYDLYVVKSRSKVVQTGQRIMAGMLSSHTFSPERIEEWNRKIKKTEGFIQKNESLLEQVKEKERVIDEMYQENCKKLAKAQEKLEEKMLLDLKMCMNG